MMRIARLETAVCVGSTAMSAPAVTLESYNEVREARVGKFKLSISIQHDSQSKNNKRPGRRSIP